MQNFMSLSSILLSRLGGGTIFLEWPFIERKSVKESAGLVYIASSVVVIYIRLITAPVTSGLV